jgi:hypothetical protein
MKLEPARMIAKGEAVLPKPWTGVDPAANGVRLLVSSLSGGGTVDAVVPGGAGWTVNAAGTRWVYSDPTGAFSGITRVVVIDRSAVEDGLLRWLVRSQGPFAALPDVAQVLTTAVLGTPNECATVAWNSPGGVSPRCEDDSAALRCR